MSRVVAFVEQQGGFATRTATLAATSRGEVDRALADNLLLTRGRGRLVLPACDEAVAVAHALRGVLCLSSAALWHGWALKTQPLLPHVAISKGRRLAGDQRRLAEIHRVAMLPDQVVAGIATDVETTLEQCARYLPEDEALAIADSALRSGVPPQTLRRVTLTVRGPGAKKVRRVLGRADERAANPFESVLRHISFDVPGLELQPQRVIFASRRTMRPDLVDEDLKGRRGRLLRVARRPGRPAPRRAPIQPLGGRRVARAPLRVGGRHVRSRLRTRCALHCCTDAYPTRLMS